MTKVYISLTSTSERVKLVHNTILSLMSQTYPFTQITLYLSHEPYLLDNGLSDAPIELSLLSDINPKFQIEFTENTGPYRKLLPMLQRHWEDDCLLVTVDDDKIYREDLVERLVEKYYQRNGEAVIANRASIRWNRVLSKYCERRYKIPKKVRRYLESNVSGNKRHSHSLAYILGNRWKFIEDITFPEGNDGVLYHPKFFTPIVFQWPLIRKLAKTHDDFWFKVCTMINGYGVSCINPYHQRPTSQLDGTITSALHFNLNRGSYTRIVLKLLEWFQREGLLG